MSGLFDDYPAPEPGPYKTVARARAADPATSHAAAAMVEASGAANTNRRLVLRLVRDYPGLTAVEIHAAQGDRGGLDRHEVSRRLADLRDAGLVVNGPERACSIKRTRMLTWEPTERGHGNGR